MKTKKLQLKTGNKLAWVGIAATYIGIALAIRDGYTGVINLWETALISMFFVFFFGVFFVIHLKCKRGITEMESEQ